MVTPAPGDNKSADRGQAGPIAVFDSGVGGLSVLRAIHDRLPAADLLYLADQAHVPYGPRPLEEVRAFAAEISRVFMVRGARLIVVACNTASAAALHELRRMHPGFPFVGMEPAVKPAAALTRTGVIGVLATPATFHGQLYASVVERFGTGRTILQDACPGLVSAIEGGDLDGPETRRILEAALRPMLAAGADVIVLGCTHYPFVIPLIRELVGPAVTVIDPAPAVARRVAAVLGAPEPAGPEPGPGAIRILTTAAPEALAALLPRLLGAAVPVAAARWTGGRLE